MPNVAESLEENYRVSLLPDFAAKVLRELRYDQPPVCRIHASGDFYNAEYVSKWIEIVSKSPRVQFLLYTRSWREPDMYGLLLELLSRDNVSGWWSADEDTGQPPRTAKWVYMSRRPSDVPSYPVDLTFVTYGKSGTKRDVAGNLICPYEQRRWSNLSCSSCKLCLRKGPVDLSPQVVSITGKFSIPLVHV